MATRIFDLVTRDKNGLIDFAKRERRKKKEGRRKKKEEGRRKKKEDRRRKKKEKRRRKKEERKSQVVKTGSHSNDRH